MSIRTLSKDSPWLLAVLATLVALGPLTIEMYLPALPGMVSWFGTTISQVQLTISSYLIGFALFHLVCGPLADRYGRKPILLLGLALYAAAGLACTTADTIGELIFYRFLQGIGACVGPTLGRAMTRDLFKAQDAARALAYIAMIMALAPAVAPALGGLLLKFYQWPVIFYALMFYALIAALVVIFLLPESLPVKQSLHPLKIARNYRQLILDRRYMVTTIASSLVYAGMIAFLSGSSFVFVDMMGVPVEYFGFLFLPTVAGYIAGNALSTRLSRRRSSQQVMWIGANLATLAALSMYLASERWFHPASIILPMSAYSVALGLVLPHAMATALKPYSHMAGTASAMLGFLQMGISSLGGALVGMLLVDSAAPMTLVIFSAAFIGWLMMRTLRMYS